MKCLDVDHVHFYVRDAEQWQQHFCECWGFDLCGVARHEDTLSFWLSQGSIHLLISQGLTPKSPVSEYLQHYAEGVADVALQVGSLDAAQAHLQNLGIPYHCLDSTALQLRVPDSGLRHTLIERSETGSLAFLGFEDVKAETKTAQPWLTHIDHVVLNVPRIPRWQGWYEQVMGWQVRYRYQIGTAHSGLNSIVLGDPDTPIQFALNEPIGSDSQIQEFLDVHGGIGIQHIAWATSDIHATIKHLQAQQIPFLPLPTKTASHPLGILIDQPDPAHPEQQVLQIFSQPLFGDPTFFVEIIERRQQAQGFGEGNFQALFEAIEIQQRQR